MTELLRILKGLASFVLLLSYLVSNQAKAQDFIFSFDSETEVIIEGNTLENAWAGGLNSAQFAQMHLNEDTLEDLLVFERTSDKVYTFLAQKKAQNYAYKHTPSYETFFPKLRGWVILEDFDQDGRKDIFTHSNFGIKVFKNISQNPRKLAWQLFTDPVKTKGYSRQINLQVNVLDFPAIVDVDRDGDLDILSFDFASGSYIEYHENQSIERYKNAEKLEFVRKTSCWGALYEGVDCGEFRFDYDCQDPKRSKGNAPPRSTHVGSTLRLLDVNGDKVRDLLVGDVSCSQMFTMINMGTNEKPKFEKYTDNFPKSKAINLGIFPAAFSLDINFDKKRDLIFAPNLFYNDKTSDFKSSSWLYLNQGSRRKPKFDFQTSAFLQNDMIDVGENACPAFLDYDKDGDLDLFIGNRGESKKGDFRASIYYFENIGTAKTPKFELATEDFLFLSEYNFTDIRPQAVDIDNSGEADLCFIANRNRKTVFYYFDTRNRKLNSVDLPLSYYDTPCLIDLDKDKDLDLIVGTKRGKLKYFENKNQTYELISENLGEVEAKSFSSIAVADLDNNGFVDMIVGSADGNLSIYPDFGQSMGEKWQAKTDFILSDITLRYQNFNLGKNLLPTLADINKDNKIDIAVGTRAGGIILLRNRAFR